MQWRGKPQVIRCDNGPEYISATLQNWASAKGIRLEYIQPGKPQQNAYVERFNRTVRYEWLSQYHWRNLDEVDRQMSASILLEAHPTLMKRPVIVAGDHSYVGWNEDVKSALGIQKVHNLAQSGRGIFMEDTQKTS